MYISFFFCPFFGGIYVTIDLMLKIPSKLQFFFSTKKQISEVHGVSIFFFVPIALNNNIKKHYDKNRYFFRSSVTLE